VFYFQAGCTGKFLELLTVCIFKENHLNAKKRKSGIQKQKRVDRESYSWIASEKVNVKHEKWDMCRERSKNCTLKKVKCFPSMTGSFLTHSPPPQFGSSKIIPIGYHLKNKKKTVLTLLWTYTK
jgi:hypothetical protein